ncbi:MAG: purine-nucleoside phosphorylase [Bdellovibrionales bacterium RIFOXYC1_FULL_54_43]|nr:MAG: purine-nucleoside phosphorylase [Bdellovibrionales bacterium RIFOXYC1_FULL_54_43]
MQQTVYQKIRDAVESIQSKTALKPEIGVILGSGLGGVADQATEAVAIPYTDIPHFHGTTIEGHAGRMVVGRFHGVPTVFLQGRFHLYEGYPMEDVAFPTRTVCGLGIHTLVLTNAAGGVNPGFQPGDLMLIKDHLNLMGDNPLKGPNLAQLGPRFPDLTEAYAKDCVEILQKSAREIGIEIHQGIYAGLLGPTYETPAEIRMYRTLGADAVGMSTVPEAIVANHLGVRVAGISYISNLAAGLSPQKLTHREVIENSKIGADKLRSLLQLAIPRLGENKVKS